MERCVVCGNADERAFRVVLMDGSSHVFDSFECAIHALAPRCGHCACRILGHGLERGGLIFCCEHCAREASGAAIDESSRESFPASDPPAFSPSARATANPPRVRHSRRLEEGKIGWVLLWVLGVPLPVLLLVFALRGCT